MVQLIFRGNHLDSKYTTTPPKANEKKLVKLSNCTWCLQKLSLTGAQFVSLTTYLLVWLKNKYILTVNFLLKVHVSVFWTLASMSTKADWRGRGSGLALIRWQNRVATTTDTHWITSPATNIAAILPTGSYTHQWSDTVFECSCQPLS